MLALEQSRQRGMTFPNSCILMTEWAGINYSSISKDRAGRESALKPVGKAARVRDLSLHRSSNSSKVRKNRLPSDTSHYKTAASLAMWPSYKKMLHQGSLEQGEQAGLLKNVATDPHYLHSVLSLLCYFC